MIAVRLGLRALHSPRTAVARLATVSPICAGRNFKVSNCKLFGTDALGERSPGTKAFGGSEKYQCVIHDLFMSYARPRSAASGDDTPCLQVDDLRSERTHPTRNSSTSLQR